MSRTAAGSTPLRVNVLVAAAIRNPKLSADGELQEEDEALMLQKIKMVLAVAKHHGVHSLILGAWGCGAFENPPRHIARLFLRVLDEHGAHFKRVIFAVVRDGNVLPFTEILVKS